MTTALVFLWLSAPADPCAALERAVAEHRNTMVSCVALAAKPDGALIYLTVRK